jgi:hypothetical protein
MKKPRFKRLERLSNRGKTTVDKRENNQRRKVRSLDFIAEIIMRMITAGG